MPGIAGIVYPDAFQVIHLINPMLEALYHRGKNPVDFHISKNIEIGICGNTLASNKTGTLIAALDGKIFNGAEIAQELRNHGYHSIRNSSAEILVDAYDLWGTSFFDHLRGEFAFAILDKEKEQLIIARDRIGKKPLYWFRNQDHFIFGSELKSLIASGAIPPTPALDAISSYLYFGYFPQDLTPIQGVNKLLPGHYLQLNKNKSQIIQQYWSFSSHFQTKITDDLEIAVPYFATLLLDSISDRISDGISNGVPSKKDVGCFLMGGIGSAAVAYYLSKLLPKDHVHAFTTGFQDENAADIRIAHEIAKELQIDQKCEIITPDSLLNNFVEISWFLDEPIADPNVIATWRLAKLAQKHSKTVFSGMASDEFLKGHSRYLVTETESKHPFQHIKLVLQQLLLPLVNILSPLNSYKMLKGAHTSPYQLTYLQQNAIFQGKDFNHAAPNLAHLFSPEIFLSKFHHISQIKSSAASFLYFDIKTRLPDSYILQYERLTSACNLDWQTPFLDRRIMEYLAGFMEMEGTTEKNSPFFLKTLLKDVFSKSITERPKKTRLHFLEPWIETSEISDLFKMLPYGVLAESGLISEKWLREQVKTPHNIRKSFKLLWSIFTLETWFRLYINSPIQTKPPNLTIRELFSRK